MRSYLLPATLFAALALSSAAFAAATTTAGTVKAYSPKHHTLTLDDGTVYYLHKHYKAHAFKAGDKVSVVWDMKGKKHEASAVTIAK